MTDYKGLIKIHPIMIGHLPYDGPSEPMHYYHSHKQIGLWPLLDGTYELIVYYSKVTDDITDLPDELRLLSILYCLALARQFEGSEDDFNMFMKMYQNSLMDYRQNIVHYRQYKVDSKDKLQIPQ